MASAWFTMSEGQVTDLLSASQRFAAKEAALDALIAAGPGGGVNYIHAAVEQLDNAQIRALPTTGVLVAPAPGAGNLIIFTRGIAAATFAADYTNVSAAATFEIQWNAGSNSVSNASLVGNGNLLDVGGGGTPFCLFSPKLTFDDPEIQEQTPIGPMSSLANVGLVIRGANPASGDYTGGDGANVLLVSVFYYVMDTATGLLVEA